MNYPRIKTGARKREPMGVKETTKVECEGHCQWLRGRPCRVAGLRGHICSGRVTVHHVQSFKVSAQEGGMGSKVGDDKGIPLCWHAHLVEVDRMGQRGFERHYGINMEQDAKAYWQADTYHRLKYERKMELERAGGATCPASTVTPE